MKNQQESRSKRVFIFAVVISTIWALASYYLTFHWFGTLTEYVGPILTFIIITGIAIIPGFLNTFLVTSILFDRNNPKDEIEEIVSSFIAEPVTILVPAYNEQAVIINTLQSLAAVNYEALVRVIIIDNNSTDNTAKLCREFIANTKSKYIEFELIAETQAGKNFALNHALQLVETDNVLTIDADTILHPDALKYIVSRINSEENIGAVAGCILVANPKATIIARMQDWDYYISINAIKRCQSEFKSTLVAQGAFSIYQTAEVKKVGGWSDCIGEDIVLSWNLLSNGKKIVFEPLAISFTEVPTTVRVFAKQRARWARGMIEAIKQIKPWHQSSQLAKFISGIDLLIPYIDFSYTVFWIPGLLLAILFQNYAIVGLYTLLVLPLSIITFLILYTRVHYYYKYICVLKRKNWIGIILFVLGYQFLMSPISLWGYIQELFGLRRVWK